ncbi:MAG: hypothetical protein FJ253_04190 [Phycisphaerae bacterium]|nr:hypothetical protein [Phycisphaerae bacterium]
MIPTAGIVAIAILLSKPAADEARALVRDVEAATADLRDFRAGVIVERVDSLTEESERRSGQVILEAASSGRRFAISFDSFIGPDGRADESRRQFVYDSGWLAEIDFERKQFVNRQIVAPGELFDPLRVGEGPLPLPLGQRAEEVFARFEVEPASPPERGLLRHLSGVRGVRLTPKPGLPEREETESVDLFYDASTLLPRGVLQRRPNGDRVEVLLREPRMNEGLDENARSLLTIRTPDPRDGWAVDVRPWSRRREGADGE